MSRSIEHVLTCIVMLTLVGTAPALAQDSQPPPGQRGDSQSNDSDALADDVTQADARDDAKSDEDRPWFQGVSRQQRIEAREHFREGNRFLRLGLFAPASEQYKKALALWKHPAFFYNLTITQLSLVQPIEAHSSILRALEHGAAGLGEDKYPRAQEYKERLESQLGKVVIACDEPDVELTLDGQPIELVGGRYEQVLLPGSHQVYAKKEQRIPEDRQVVISPGERVEVNLVLGIPDKIETVRYMPSWIPWTALALSAGVLGGAGYLDWNSSQELASFDADFNSECRRGCLENEVPEIIVRLTSAEGEKRAALGLYIAGGAMAIGSVALIYINRERIKKTKVKRESFSVIPIMGPERAGLSAAFRF